MSKPENEGGITPESIAAQYSSGKKLDTRISLHDQFSTSHQSWFEFVFQTLPLRPGTRVLEVGAGTGKLWTENQAHLPPNTEYTLTDRSPGMVEQARASLDSMPGFHFAAADILHLPFASASQDLVIANHMLYHIQDMPRALAEVRRVLKPGGRFIAATNGVQHMAKLNELMFGDVNQGMTEIIQNFNLENGEDILRQAFEYVTLHIHDNNLRVTDAEALINYALSLPVADRMSESAKETFKTAVIDHIAHHGSLFITKSSGVFEAW